VCPLLSDIYSDIYSVYSVNYSDNVGYNDAKGLDKSGSWYGKDNTNDNNVTNNDTKGNSFISFKSVKFGIHFSDHFKHVFSRSSAQFSNEAKGNSDFDIFSDHFKHVFSSFETSSLRPAGLSLSLYGVIFLNPVHCPPFRFECHNEI
jgi:hypothetical protein